VTGETGLDTGPETVDDALYGLGRATVPRRLLTHAAKDVALEPEHVFARRSVGQVAPDFGHLGSGKLAIEIGEEIAKDLLAAVVVVSRH